MLGRMIRLVSLLLLFGGGMKVGEATELNRRADGEAGFGKRSEYMHRADTRDEMGVLMLAAGCLIRLLSNLVSRRR